MAIVGKLTKLKSAMKRWPSFTKPARSASGRSLSLSPSPSPAANNADGESAMMMMSAASINNNSNLHPVYVGKSRRRYLISPDVAAHPLFQELVVDEEEEEEGERGCGAGFVVACEVVLFEHLLWMLETNAAEEQLGSVDELVQFYTC